MPIQLRDTRLLENYSNTLQFCPFELFLSLFFSFLPKKKFYSAFFLSLSLFFLYICWTNPLVSGGLVLFHIKT